MSSFGESVGPVPYSNRPRRFPCRSFPRMTRKIVKSLRLPWNNGGSVRVPSALRQVASGIGQTGLRHRYLVAKTEPSAARNTPLPPPPSFQKFRSSFAHYHALLVPLYFYFVSEALLYDWIDRENSGWGKLVGGGVCLVWIMGSSERKLSSMILIINMHIHYRSDKYRSFCPILFVLLPFFI